VAYGPGQGYPPQPPAGEGGGVNPDWLAASADRERAVGVLRAGFTEGRLTQDELDERVARAYAARTYGQLWALTADLPAGALPVPHFQPGTGALVPAQNTAPSHWRPAAALVITALVIFTLAALITAIITAHTQTVVYTPFQQVQVAPYVQQAGPANVAPLGSPQLPAFSPGNG
jgi:hypothetical protein